MGNQTQADIDAAILRIPTREETGVAIAAVISAFADWNEVTFRTAVVGLVAYAIEDKDSTQLMEVIAVCRNHKDGNAARMTAAIIAAVNDAFPVSKNGKSIKKVPLAKGLVRITKMVTVDGVEMPTWKRSLLNAFASNDRDILASKAKSSAEKAELTALGAGRFYKMRLAAYESGKSAALEAEWVADGKLAKKEAAKKALKAA